jgi:hypothetical protein
LIVFQGKIKQENETVSRETTGAGMRSIYFYMRAQVFFHKNNRLICEIK